jgi:GNAT superfamily N-acetyltransferase
MAGTQGWDNSVKAVFGERLRTVPRYSFSSDQLSLDYLQALASANPNTPDVLQVDVTLAGMNSPYLGIGAFDSPEDFVERGIGFCMLKEDTIIGGAYSSLVCSDAIEVSIVVDPAHRRQGIASALATQLLLWCLEHHLAPHWDAANEESCNLAEKLGYTNKEAYIAYFLK